MTFPLWLTTVDRGDDHAERSFRQRETESVDRAAGAWLSPDEHALVARVRAGDRIAMDALVRTHFEGLARYADCLLRSRDDAEDVVQDVLARVWETRDSWMPTTVRAYLLGAVRNGVIDLRRRRDSRTRREARIDLAPHMVLPPDASLVDAEVVTLLHRAIDALPARWREVIALRYEQQLAFRDVGRILGISDDAAKKLAQRAIVELRRSVGL